MTSTWRSLVDWFAPTDDSAIMVLVPPVAANGVRLSITAGAVPPQIGVLLAGRALQMPRPTVFAGHAPLASSRRTIVRTARSETGETLGRTVQRVDLSGSFRWEALPDTFVRGAFADFQRAAESESFFIAWRPSAYSDCHLCTADEGPIPDFGGARALMGFTVTVRAQAHD